MRKYPRWAQPALILTALSLFPVLAPPGAGAAASPGGRLPEVSFPVPGQPGDQQYLGLAGKTSFRIPQIRAEAVIVEIFSMYCPVCQKEAPRVNELYRAVEEDPELQGKIKLLGIGAGNSAFETGVFREKYGVPFPLLPDEDLSFVLSLGVMATPHFVVIRINRDGSHEIVYSRSGGIGDPKLFLEEVGTRAGLAEAGAE